MLKVKLDLFYKISCDNSRAEEEEMPLLLKAFITPELWRKAAQSHARRRAGRDCNPDNSKECQKQPFTWSRKMGF